jgi:DNA-binding response OmpR family regulator
LKEALRKNILVVEDEKNIRKVIRLYLQKAGFEVIEANNGKMARSQFLKHDPCFVILDLMLPGEDGTSICHWIRNDLQSNAPIMIVSAKSSEEDRIQGLQKGADDFLSKPFSPGELVARVETVLRRTADC